MRIPLKRLLALLFSFALIAAACGSDAEDAVDEVTDTAEEVVDDAEEAVDDAEEVVDDATEEDAMEEDEAMAGVSLADVCPSPVVIQTD